MGAVLLSPSALAFATGSVTSQDVTVRNTGTTTVNLPNAANSITIASNPGGAFTQSNTCGGSLAPGATCTITVTFAVPAAAATATVTARFVGLPNQTVSVTGAGTLYTVTPTSWTYVQVANPRPAGTLGLTHNFTVTAGAAAMPFSAMTLGGTNPFEFRIMTNNCPVAPVLLAANASCTVGVAFAPTQVGTKTATLNVAPANGAPPTLVTLTGTATVASAGSYFLLPRTAAFGPVQVGTTPAHTLTLTLQNNRPASTPLSLSSFIIGGPGASQYTLTSPAVGGCPATIAAGTTCSLTVTFTPSGGDAIATVFGPAAAQNVNLTGTGLVPVFALSPSPVVVGSLGLGVQSPPVVVTLTNSGPGALSGITTAIGGTNAAEFTVAPLSCGTTLAVSASCTFNVTFTQQIAGISRATLTVNVDPTLGATPATVALISAPPSASLTGATGAFFNQTIGAVPAAQQTFTYTNTGIVPISIAPGTGAVTGITVTGSNATDFVATTTCTTAPMAPGASCPITVTFNPTVVGSEGPATLTVTDTASGAPPQTATLTGTGTNAAATLVGIGAFGNQSVGVASAVHAFTYTNTGTTPITIAAGGIAVTGTNVADFGQTNNCPTTPIAANGSCTINVTYTPSAQGAESAVLSVTDTTGGAPTKTASLTGTGVLISASLTGTGAFGNGQIGVPSVASTFTYANTGTVAITIATGGIAVTGANVGDFAIGANTCPTTPMAPAASCTFTVTFTAGAVGSRTATLTVTDTAGGAAPQTAALSGTGVSATASLTGTAAFGTFQTGVASPVHAFTYTNTGVGPITIATGGIGVTGANSGDFAVQPTSNCPTTAMAAGASCTINVIFTPSVLGAEAATLTVTDTAGGAAPQTVNMTGTGATGTASLTGTAAFGNQQIGIASSAHPFVYTNTGAGPITIAAGGIGVTGAYPLDFGQTNNCPTTPMAAGTSCTINVVFTPSTLLGETATLTVTDTALGAAPQSVLMTGTGQPPSASLTGQAAYGTQQTGTAATNAFTYTNTGQGPITIAPSGITLSGGNVADFTQTNNCPTASMAAGTSCTINVTFTPSAVGSRGTTLAVADTAGGAPTQSVPLTGAGQAPSATLTPPSLLNLAASTGNSSVPLSTTLLNTGIGPITVGTPVLQAAVPPVGVFTEFAVTGNTCPPVLLSGASCQITVTYTVPDGESTTGQDSAQFAIDGTVPLVLLVHGHVDQNL